LTSDPTIDRSRLPIRRPSFAGVTAKTLEGSEPDWNQAAHVAPPDGNAAFSSSISPAGLCARGFEPGRPPSARPCLPPSGNWRFQFPIYCSDTFARRAVPEVQTKDALI
jgi:hypothetical protein